MPDPSFTEDASNQVAEQNDAALSERMDRNDWPEDFVPDWSEL